MPVSLKNIHTQIKQIIEIENVTKFERIELNGYIYFGTYTFLIIVAFLLKEVIAAFVDELKKSNNNLPVNKNTG
jgi:hypothetical protein